MNYMRNIAEILGVELEEEFNIVDRSKSIVYKMTLDGLQSKRSCDDETHWSAIGNSGVLRDILLGFAVIEKKPWKPRNDETYFYISSGDAICTAVFAGWCCSDLEHVKIGNYFRTKEEAERNIEAFNEYINGEPDMSWRVKE